MKRRRSIAAKPKDHSILSDADLSLNADVSLARIVEVFRPYAGRLIKLALISVVLTIFGGATQIALTPLLEIVLGRGGEAIQSSAPTSFSFDLNQLGLSVLALLSRATHLTNRWHLLLVSTGLYVLLSIVNQVAAFATRQWSVKIRLDMVRRLEYKIFAHLVRLPLSFLKKHSPGWLQSRMSDDVDQAVMLVNDLLIDGLSSSLLSLFYVLLLFFTDARLSLIVAIAGLAQLGLSRAMVKMAESRTLAASSARAYFSTFRQERLQAFREIKLFSAEQQEGDEFLRRALHQVASGVRYMFYRQIEGPIRFVVNRLVIATVMLFGAWHLLNGDITTSAFLLFMYFTQSLIGPLTSVASLLLRVVDIQALLRGALFLLQQPAESKAGSALLTGGFRDSLTLRNVSFAYDTLPVVQNVDLTIRKGEMIALVGRSGAGKSTLVDLLLRLHDPTEGVIELDGVPITHYQPASYRQLFGVVSQDPLLFNDTVFNNIAYARPHLTAEEVENAAQIAHAAEFIDDMPERYLTLLGDRGVRLSGGQRQRIAIARAVVHQPEIIIFDEATSSLDSESERLVQDAIATIMNRCTAIVVAHRLSTVQMADHIVVLKEGRIIEIGTHDELYRHNGEYRLLYDVQFRAVPNAAG